ncbi:hypothetical protein [Halobaculum gomorrense]|uniref:hypothetical protein n=1 Tax=Halobaculum gomorrense TaxID=43928 RepID=UPI000934E723|nr:hypothetical protein [Halobaculum gomorrense]
MPTDAGTGVLVSVDRGLEGSVDAVVDRCRAALEQPSRTTPGPDGGLTRPVRFGPPSAYDRAR